MKRQHGQQIQQQHKSSAIVVPQGRVLIRSHQVAERIKDSRLKGADLYVARLGRVGSSNHFDCGCQLEKAKIIDEFTSAEATVIDVPVIAETQHLTGSLHDELRFPIPKERKLPVTRSQSSSRAITATHSRPCYRCISYMHSAGIKRVFWTNEKGEWEGGKVRDLVDALEGSLSPGGESPTNGSGSNSVYVTKSEVLMMKGLR